MSFQEIEFKEFVTLQRGFDLPKTQMKDGEVPVLGSNCVIGYHNEAKVEPPGVVTGRSGTLGAVQYIDEPYWPHNTSLWVKDFKDNLPSYVYYKLQTLQLERFNGGASVPTLNRNVLDTLKIKVPDLPTQERIAEVLSAYDDLIENNRRRIKLLEDSARLLYREWFVHFRFPGHEHIPRTPSGLPEGWEEGTVGHLAELQSGYAFKSKDWLEDGNPVIKIKNITGNGDVDINDCQCVSDEIAEKAAKFEIKSGDILFAMTGATVGKTGILPISDRRFYLNQRVGRFISRKEFPVRAFLASALSSDHCQHQVKNLAGGAAQPNISGSQIEGMKISVPDDKLLEMYADYCEPSYDQILVLGAQNQKLAAARDILLPRLMNGEVAV